MKKKKFLIPLLLAVLLTAAALWYTRPMTVYEIFPQFQAETSLKTWGRLEHYEDISDGQGFPDLLHLAGDTLHFEAGTSEYDAFLALLDEIEVRRSLWDLLPKGKNVTRSHPLSPGDYMWRLMYNPPGSYLEVEWWFDRAYVTYDHEEYRCSLTGGAEQAAAIRDFLYPYTAPYETEW